MGSKNESAFIPSGSTALALPSGRSGGWGESSLDAEAAAGVGRTFTPKQQQEPSGSAGDPKAAALYNNTPPLYNILYYIVKGLSRDMLINLIKNFLTFGEHISGQSQKNSV